VNRAKKAANPAKERDYPPDTGVESDVRRESIVMLQRQTEEKTGTK